MSDRIAYREGYKYQLAADYSIETGIEPPERIETDYLRMEAGGLLTCLKGYAWDGASGWTFDTNDSMRGSLVHDALYQLMREGLLPQSCRPPADDLLRTLLLADRMFRPRAAVWHLAVRIGAGPAAIPSDAHPILFAPSPPAKDQPWRDA
jgi:hypothetical protein